MYKQYVTRRNEQRYEVFSYASYNYLLCMRCIVQNLEKIWLKARVSQENCFDWLYSTWRPWCLVLVFWDSGVVNHWRSMIFFLRKSNIGCVDWVTYTHTRGSENGCFMEGCGWGSVTSKWRTEIIILIQFHNFLVCSTHIIQYYHLDV